MTIRAALLLLALEAVPGALSWAQTVDSIAPGMSEADVSAILGAPLRTRQFGEYRYLFYDSACEECGFDDLVVIQNGAVVDAVFRSTGRVYSPVKSSLVVRPPAAGSESHDADSVPDPPPSQNAETQGRRPVITCELCVSAEAAPHVPETAKELVAHVIGRSGGSTAEQLGAGIVFGMTSDRVYVATAKHVVRREGELLDDIRVVFRGAPLDMVAADLEQVHGQLDLAVVSAPRRWSTAFEDGPPRFDYLGNVGALGSGDPVTPMGCPDGSCWGPPTQPDKVFATGRLSMSFETVAVTTGYSGGGVFNEWWEVVGMITVEQGQIARADAIPISTVLETVKAWGYPVGLKSPSIPRRGYRTTVGVVGLTSTSSSDSPYGDDRIPSGRLVVTHEVLPRLSAHAGVLRLAPTDLGLTAGMVGLGLNLRTGRFTARPFVEAGYGHVESRVDAGGFCLEDNAECVLGAGPGYVPAWVVLENDGVGAGVGLVLHAIVVPRTLLEVVVGHWEFDLPESDTELPTGPGLPGLFVGVGLGVGL